MQILASLQENYEESHVLFCPKNRFGRVNQLIAKRDEFMLPFNYYEMWKEYFKKTWIDVFLKEINSMKQQMKKIHSLAVGNKFWNDKKIELMCS